jgi:hypothetical protein
LVLLDPSVQCRGEQGSPRFHRQICQHGLHVQDMWLGKNLGIRVQRPGTSNDKMANMTKALPKEG